MYLAQEPVNERLYFWIRQSVLNRETGVYYSDDLFELGEDPTQWIVYSGGRSFYIDEDVSFALGKKGVTVSISELEDLFYPFLRRNIREVVEQFSKGRRGRLCPVNDTEQESIRKLHIFDKRRMHYLYYGAIDQGRLERVPQKLFRKLLGKSRDEREQFFVDLETHLPEDEFCRYIYTIFNLQRFFTESFSRAMPEALDSRKIDVHFTRELNLLHGDQTFWDGMEREDTLHYYLSRYVTRYFHSQFAAGGGWEEYIRNFMNDHRQHVQPQRKKSEILHEAASVFDVQKEQLQKMNKRELSKLYRQKAHEHHPDKGGEQDEFVKLTELYQKLVNRTTN